MIISLKIKPNINASNLIVLYSVRKKKLSKPKHKMYFSGE